jgi:hypothetical protein
MVCSCAGRNSIKLIPPFHFGSTMDERPRGVPRHEELRQVNGSALLEVNPGPRHQGALRMTGADGRDWTRDEPMPFSEDDVLLPWLESDEPLEEPRASGPRRLWLATAAGALLAAVAGGVYWLAGEGDAPPATEASPIETLERPRNEGPANGVRTATPSASRGPQPAAAEPAVEAPVATRQGAASTSIEPGPAVPAPQPDGFIVQVGAYGSRRRADIGWEFLTGSQPVLQGVPHRVVRAVVDGKTVYRLQAMVESPSAAGELCAALQANGAECLVRN